MEAPEMKRVLVPLMIAVSGAFMASAWLAHLRFKDRIGFGAALLASWAIVLPEYALNVAATRYGYGTFTGAQMAAIHLCSGVACVALVSRFVLGEPLGGRHAVGVRNSALVKPENLMLNTDVRGGGCADPGFNCHSASSAQGRIKLN